MGKWEMVRLGDVATFINGDRGVNYPSAKDFCESGVPFINAGHLENEAVSFSKMNYISEQKYDKLGSGKIKNGDLLYCLRGSLGKQAVVTNVEKGAIASSLVIIRPHNIHIDFLRYCLKTNTVLEQQTKANNGSSQPNLSASSVKNYTIPLPSLPTQQKIADILDRASTLIEQRKAQIAKLDLLVKSRFMEMFGDPVGNPMGWEVRPLEEYILFLTSGSRGWSGYFADDGEMFITIKNVKNSSITTDNMQYIHAPNTKEAERTRVQTGDLLISITADLGRTGIVEAEVANHGAYINQHLSLVRLDQGRINPYFASYFLETAAGKSQFERKNQVGVKAGLNFDAIKSLAIAVPPLERQTAFVRFVECVKVEKERLRKGLLLLELNYKALMQQCFEGEIG